MADLLTTNGSRRWAAITTSDTVNIGETPRAIYVGVGGDIAMVGADGVATTFKAAASGSILPIQPVRVNATNTTAANLVALY